MADHSRYIGFNQEKTPGYETKKDWMIEMPKKPVEERVKDFIASYRALCVRHDLMIIPEFFEDGLRIQPFVEETMIFVEQATLSKELQEDGQSQGS